MTSPPDGTQAPLSVFDVGILAELPRTVQMPIDRARLSAAELAWVQAVGRLRARGLVRSHPVDRVGAWLQVDLEITPLGRAELAFWRARRRAEHAAGHRAAHRSAPA